QSPVDGIMPDMRKGRVRVGGRVTLPRQAIYEAGAPGVAAKQPVDIGLLERPELLIATQLAVPGALNGKGGGQVIAAPDKRNAAVKGIVLRFLPDELDALFVPLQCLRIIFLRPGQRPCFSHADKLIMSQVDKRIPLVVARCVLTHPRSDFLLIPG